MPLRSNLPTQQVRHSPCPSAELPHRDHGVKATNLSDVRLVFCFCIAIAGPDYPHLELLLAYWVANRACDDCSIELAISSVHASHGDQAPVLLSTDPPASGARTTYDGPIHLAAFRQDCVRSNNEPISGLSLVGILRRTRHQSHLLFDSKTQIHRGRARCTMAGSLRPLLA